MSNAPHFAGRVIHPQGEGIVYGPGCARAELPGLLRRAGVRRPMLVTTPSLVRNGLASEVAAWLGDDIVVFAESREHTPSPVVLEAARMAGGTEVDGLVSLGGSSVVDLTKGIALVLAEGDDLDRLCLRIEPAGGGQRPVLNAPKLPHFALPTTLSGAEFTSAAGITDPPTGEKRIYIDPKLAPRWVCLDPDLTRSTPVALWASTGMKVLSDTIEVFCSPRNNPLAEAVAGGALRLLVESLQTGTEHPEDVDARGRCLFAVGMTLSQLSSVGLGLVAALRHQLGGTVGVAHGVASTIVLPHVMRWNRPDADAALTRAAAAAGVEDADALIVRVESMTDSLGLPRRLRDVDVRHADLESVARHVLGDPATRTNARPLEGVADVLDILEQAW